MDSNFNVEVAKIRSLMERVEKPHTNYQAVLNEERLVNEANGIKKEVTRNEIIDILEDQDAKGNGSLLNSLQMGHYKHSNPYAKNSHHMNLLFY